MFTWVVPTCQVVQIKSEALVNSSYGQGRPERCYDPRFQGRDVQTKESVVVRWDHVCNEVCHAICILQQHQVL